MNQSTNYNFNLPEGTDLVNLLTQLIPNWNSLDSILKGVENQAFTICTEVTSLGVHAISRTNADGKILKWIATANFTAGDTFTVDGNVVAASTPAGATLATNAYVTGSVIIAALNSDESAMTIFVSGTNVATDSERLGGELPAYYATDSDMETAKQAIEDLDNLMGTTSISAIADGTVTGAVSELSNMCNFSSSEVKIGKFNGADVYKRTFSATSVNITGEQYITSAFTSASVSMLLAKFGNIHATNGFWFNDRDQYSGGTYEAYFRLGTGGVQICMSDYTCDKYSVTFIYTKA